MSEEIENKIAKANIIQIDLKDFKYKGDLFFFDLKQTLWQEMVLKEDLFRDFIKNFDWNQYTDKKVGVYCSADAIIPSWVYMLIRTELYKVYAKAYFGNKNEVEEILFFENLNQIKINDFLEQRVMVKGCSEIPNPEKAYFVLTELLIPHVKSLMFGEPCSAVPVYKKK